MSNLIETEMCKRRKERKLSQWDLAGEMNVSRNCIQQLECHEHLPKLLTLIKLTRVLGLDDKEYADFMVQLRYACEADETVQSELEGSAV